LNTLKEHDAAIIAYQQAIRLDYADYYGLASALGYAGRDEEAVKAFEKAVRRSPRQAFYHLCLGNAYRKVGRLDEARTAWVKAWELDPNGWSGESAKHMLAENETAFSASQRK